MAAKQRKQAIQTNMLNALDQVAKDNAAPAWVIRSIRARIPDLVERAVIPRAASGASDELAVAKEAPEQFSPKDIQEAIQSYARSIVRQSALHGRQSTQLLIQSAAWRKSLPCCSKLPIWPACRRDC
jgi:hypothetical protein